MLSRWLEASIRTFRAACIGPMLGACAGGLGFILGGTPARIVSTMLAGAVIGGGIAWVISTLPNKAPTKVPTTGPDVLGSDQHEEAHARSCEMLESHHGRCPPQS